MVRELSAIMDFAKRHRIVGLHSQEDLRKAAFAELYARKHPTEFSGKTEAEKTAECLLQVLRGNITVDFKGLL